MLRCCEFSVIQPDVQNSQHETFITLVNYKWILELFYGTVESLAELEPIYLTSVRCCYPECREECFPASSHGRWCRVSVGVLWRELSQPGRNCHTTIKPHALCACLLPQQTATVNTRALSFVSSPFAEWSTHVIPLSEYITTEGYKYLNITGCT